MRTKPSAAALAVLALAALPGSLLAETNGKVVFQNNLADRIGVEILHSDGDLQKGRVIEAGGSHTFKIGAGSECKNKTRKFVVRSGKNEMVASGQFSFRGYSMGGYCRMEVRTGDRLIHSSLDESVEISAENTNTKLTFTLGPASDE